MLRSTGPSGALALVPIVCLLACAAFAGQASAQSLCKSAGKFNTTACSSIYIECTPTTVKGKKDFVATPLVCPKGQTFFPKLGKCSSQRDPACPKKKPPSPPSRRPVGSGGACGALADGWYACITKGPSNQNSPFRGSYMNANVVQVINGRKVFTGPQDALYAYTAATQAFGAKNIEKRPCAKVKPCLDAASDPVAAPGEGCSLADGNYMCVTKGPYPDTKPNNNYIDGYLVEIRNGQKKFAGNKFVYPRQPLNQWARVLAGLEFAQSGTCSQLEACPAAQDCGNNIKDGSETGVDCGGPDCQNTCPENQGCDSKSDCSSGLECINKICKLPACDDGIFNGLETDIDCGGTCPKCQVSQTCKLASDCATNVCRAKSAGTARTCQAPTCTDSLKNGNETDVDCGGSCPKKCGSSLLCNTAEDCVSGVCELVGSLFKCQAPSCTDGVKNAAESDVDCGGPCSKCAVGKACSAGSDCESLSCRDGVCQAPTCSDNIKNDVETDTDCGGGSCPGCADGLVCKTNKDCATGYCNPSGKCQNPTCEDGVKNGLETDTDCGGSFCLDRCILNEGCLVSEDCINELNCVNGTCK